MLLCSLLDNQVQKHQHNIAVGEFLAGYGYHGYVLFL